jgi:hypothetical protein
MSYFVGIMFFSVYMEEVHDAEAVSATSEVNQPGSDLCPRKPLSLRQ